MSELGPSLTIEELVAAARAEGFGSSVRQIRDWTELGLLDYPSRRPAGRGKGSHSALYSPQQRHLLMILLHHRQTNGIRGLARIPVGMWMYFGEDYVGVGQARRALVTWLGDPRVSKRQARESARQLLSQLDNPAATLVARRELVETLTDVAYTGRADLEHLALVVKRVFDPANSSVSRTVGHPSAPLSAESVVDLVRARLVAVELLLDQRVTDKEMRAAKHAHLVSYAEYAAEQPALAGYLPTGQRLYEPVDAETAFNQCCVHLLTTLGLSALHPDRTRQLGFVAAPHMVFPIAPPVEGDSSTANQTAE